MTVSFGTVTTVVSKGVNFSMSLLKTNSKTKALSVERLREIVKYDQNTGEFLWQKRPVRHFVDGRADPDIRARRWNGKYAGKRAFTCRDPRGYAKGEVSGVFVWAHRVAWALASGEWPSKEIDHINRDKSDNRLVNLREVTHRINASNRDQSRCGHGARR